MSLENGIEANDIKEHINYLVNYMKQNKYYFTYPDDIWVPLNINYVLNDMVRKQYKLVLRKIKSFIIGILVWIKHKILRS